MSAAHMPRAGSSTPQALPANWTSRFALEDLQDTQRLARRLAEHIVAGDLLILTGGLGAGKTTFTQALAEAIGVEGQITSPTFVLSRIHRSAAQGPDLVHVDAYRTDAEGVESLDLPATMPGSVTVVEWGRGQVERALAGPEGSWLDLEFTHPTSALAGTDTAAAAGSAREFVTDFSESEADLLGAPRTAVLRGYGHRWPQSPV